MPRLSVPAFDTRAAVALCAALAAFAVTAFAPQVLNDGDTFLHIAAGRRMIADHAILFSDPFSFTKAGAPWNAHEWLAEIAMAFVYQLGGWSGLIAMFAVAAAVTAGVLTYQLGRWLAPQAQAIAALLAMCCMTGSLLARPHLLALPLLAIWTAELVRARADRRRPSLWLLPMLIIWINIHASFMLGVAVAAVLGLEALVEASGARWKVLRDWGLFGTAAAVACLINPHFLQGVLFPLTLMGTPSLANIDEWQPTDLSHVQPIVLAAATALYVMLTRGVKMSAVRTLLVLGLLYLALQHQRHQIVVAVIAPLLLAEPLSQALGAVRARLRAWPALATAALATVAIVALLATRLALPLVRGDGAVAPMTALANVPAGVRAEPVLNDYGFGGYLIFAGVRPFIDSRAELYGEPALQRYAELIRPDSKALAAAIRHYGIRWSILSPTSPMVAEFDKLTGWHRVHSDAFAVVHIRDSTAR